MKILAKKFTNKVPIFINEDYFAKCSADQSVRQDVLTGKTAIFRFARKIKPSDSFCLCLMSITEGDCHAYAKTRMRFAINRNSTGFSI